MANIINMPTKGTSVKTCILSEWRKQVGDQIQVGDILFAYETSKTSYEYESTVEGELLAVFYDEGDEVPVFAAVCAIGLHGEAVADRNKSENSAAPQTADETSPSAANTPPSTDAPVSDRKPAISPRARKLARVAGADISRIAGTGPDGRIIERDVRRLIELPPTLPEIAAPAPTPVSSPEEYQDVTFSGIRRAISRSMYTSLSTMAQLTHNSAFDATAIMDYRKQLKAAGGEYAAITIGDMVLYAVSRTLPDHPDLNANMLDDNHIRRFHHVNLGVAIHTPRGLMVPTIFHAEEMSLLEISRTVKELALQCRDGSISPDLLSGGSFTVSNLGSMGVESFTPVINPPQTGILGVCAPVDRVRRGIDGTADIYPAMGLSLTYDHRAVDGTPAAHFQKELSNHLENFTVLLSK